MLNNTNISKSATILLSSIAIGMVLIAFVIFVALVSVKNNYDFLYQKVILPSACASKLKYVYHENIPMLIEKHRDGCLSFGQILEKTQELIKSTQKELEKFESENGKKPICLVENIQFAFKNLFGLCQNQLEKPNENIKSIIKNLNNLTLSIENAKNNNTKEGENKFLEDLEQISDNNYEIVKKSLTTYLEMAENIKNKIDSIYKYAITLTLIIIVFISVSFFIFSKNILSNIRNINFLLKKSVDEKTKELLDLNNELQEKTKKLVALNLDLEERVAKEVENSRKKDEIMFTQARLASLGEMIANIAHQWRQPLNSLVLIIQSFELKMMAKKLDEKFVEEQVQNGLRVAKNMSDTIDDFRNFFKPKTQKELFNIKKACEDALFLTNACCVQEKIDITIQNSRQIDVLGYQNEFTHVLLNLISNSRDAFKIRDIKDRKIKIILSFSSKKKKIIVKYIDNAGGIEQNVLNRAFEPYFTTKHQFSGTGIGLYMSKLIIEKHMLGKISAENKKFNFSLQEPSDCAIFTIQLPKLN